MDNYQENLEKISRETTNVISTVDSYWLWIAIVECIIIIFLFILIFRIKSNIKSNATFADLDKSKLKKSVKDSMVNMDDLMNSINSSKALYKILSRKCHPDRFINTDKHKTAQDIFQEISKNKRNYKVLQELKIQAEIKLDIKI